MCFSMEWTTHSDNLSVVTGSPNNGYLNQIYEEQSMTNHTVDLSLALILLLGSTIGAQFGVRLSHKLNANYLKLVLASVVLLVMVKILSELTFPPDLMLGIKGGR